MVGVLRSACNHFTLFYRYDSMDPRKRKNRSTAESIGTDWRSDAGSISGAKFIQTPLCDNDDDDEMELTQYVI